MVCGSTRRIAIHLPKRYHENMQCTSLPHIVFVSGCCLDNDKNASSLLTFRGRFTISNVTTDWAKAAEDDALGVSSGNKGPRRRGDDLSDDEEDTGNALLRNSSALKGGNGSVLEPGHLDIVRWEKRHFFVRYFLYLCCFPIFGQLNLSKGRKYHGTLRGVPTLKSGVPYHIS